MSAEPSRLEQDIAKWFELFDHYQAECARLRAELLQSYYERDKYRQTTREWIEANAPGGWIDLLRGELDGLRAELERVTRERDKWLTAFNGSEQFQSGPHREVAALHATVQRLRDALTKAHEFIANVEIQGDWWRRQQAALCDELDAVLAASPAAQEE